MKRNSRSRMYAGALWKVTENLLELARSMESRMNLLEHNGIKILDFEQIQTEIICSIIELHGFKRSDDALDWLVHPIYSMLYGDNDIAKCKGLLQERFYRLRMERAERNIAEEERFKNQDLRIRRCEMEEAIAQDPQAVEIERVEFLLKDKSTGEQTVFSADWMNDADLRRLILKVQTEVLKNTNFEIFMKLSEKDKDPQGW